MVGVTLPLPLCEVVTVMLPSVVVELFSAFLKLT